MTIDYLHADVILAAQTWRRQRGYNGRGGVVIVFEGFATGWVNTLRDPDHWEPGAIAVDEIGHTWRAVGGDARNGATTWMPTNTRTWRSTKYRTDWGVPMKHTYEILPRPIEIGGGWRLRLLEDGQEVAGGTYPAPPADDDTVRTWWTALGEDGRQYWQGIANSRDPVKAHHAYLLAESHTAAEEAAYDWLDSKS